jgi:hypothetical protein
MHLEWALEEILTMASRETVHPSTPTPANSGRPGVSNRQNPASRDERPRHPTAPELHLEPQWIAAIDAATD